MIRNTKVCAEEVGEDTSGARAQIVLGRIHIRDVHG